MRHHAGRARLVRASTAALLVVGLVMAAGCAPGPPQPPTGPGSNTPCGRTDVQLTNPGAATNAIYVAYPTGTAATPLMGGTCGDDQRPVLFLVHGYLASFNWVYEGVINHFTRTGNIVVMGTYATDIADVQGSADRALQALTAAVPQLEREDLTHVGLIGHSLGGGMLPWVTQQVVARGWGSAGLWMFSLAPFQGIGSGPIGQMQVSMLLGHFPELRQVFLFDLDRAAVPHGCGERQARRLVGHRPRCPRHPVPGERERRSSATRGRPGRTQRLRHRRGRGDASTGRARPRARDRVGPESPGRLPVVRVQRG